MDNYSGLRTNLTMLMDFYEITMANDLLYFTTDIVTGLLILICFFVMYQMTAALVIMAEKATTHRIF